MSTMNSDPAEEDLRSLFRRLKHQDERTAPDFARLLTRPQPQPRIRRPVIAFAALIVLLGAIFFAVEEYRDNESIPETAAITSWRSPTAFLLRTPGDQFLREVPELGQPLIQYRKTYNSEDL